MTSNNSTNATNKIHIGDSGSYYTGDIHLSQYKDPNDDLTPSDDLNDHAKELFHPNYEETYDEDLNTNISRLTQLNHRFNDNSNQDKNDFSDKTKHTTTFRTANDNGIEPSTVSLIPKKRNTPSVFKKFQAHPPKTQPPTITPTYDKRHSSNNPDFFDTPSTPIRRDLHDWDDNNKDRQELNHSSEISDKDKLERINEEHTYETRSVEHINNDCVHKSRTEQFSENFIDAHTKDGTEPPPNVYHMNIQNIRNPYAKQFPNNEDQNNIAQGFSTPIPDTPPFLSFSHQNKLHTLKTVSTGNIEENNRRYTQDFNPDNIGKCVLSLKPQALKNSNRSVNLPPDLESLRSVIMSQHTALEPHIKELGKICLDFTTNIKKKKESSMKLITENRTP